MKTLENYNILLIDDDEDITDLLKIVLERAGARVITAYDGSVGLRSVLSQKFDVIITDLRMPFLRGEELVKVIRSSVHNRKTKVFVISSHIDEPVVVELIQSGITDVITKPIDPNLLVTRIVNKVATPA